MRSMITATRSVELSDAAWEVALIEAARAEMGVGEWVEYAIHNLAVRDLGLPDELVDLSGAEAGFAAAG